MSEPELSRNELALSYYQSVCAAIAKYVEEGGPLKVSTEVQDGETVITFVLDHERAGPYFQGAAADPERIG